MSAGDSWAVLGLLGCAFMLVGALDIGMAWFPLAFDSAEWEFGTLTGMLNGLPVVAMGVGLAIAGALGVQGLKRARFLSVLAAVITVLLLASAFLYVTVLPMALSGARDPVVAASLRKAAFKGSALLIVYPLLFTALAVWGWRRSLVVRVK